MKKSSIVLSVLAVALLLAHVHAQSDEKTPRLPGTPGTGGPGGPGGFGAPGQERKIVAQFDKDGDKRLSTTEREAAREFMKKNPGRGMGAGPGGPGAGPGGPGGGRGGPALADPLLKAIDSDQDGKLTSAEFVAGVKQFHADADTAKKGSLDATAMADQLNVIVPPPPGAPGAPAGPAGPGAPGGAPRRGLGTFLGPALLTRADANKDDKATLEELTAAAEVIFKEADKDKSGKADATEINTAIAALMPMRGPGGPEGGGPGGPGGQRDPAKPGPRVSPSDVKSYPDASLYEPTVLRTIFIDFENTKDWEAELADFNNTDVEVPATLTVDGKKYAGVGIHFRGQSSFGMVPAGYKRSLNLAMDYADDKQRLYGFKTLNLLNCAGDPSLLSSVLYSHIARAHIPAPRANLVKVVINGESWGIYANLQQFNKELLADQFKTEKGARWKVPGSPNGQGGLEYLGENIADYERRYDMKSKENDADWKRFIELCRVLNKTPADKLEEAIAPLLDIDGALWFLALDVALINSDGYWTRASDYSIFLDESGKFHLIPHDMNEAFHGAGGPGGPGGPGGRGPGGPDAGGGAGGRGGAFELDPLTGLHDARKPLRSKLLAVPALRAKYLSYVRAIAQDELDWAKLGPVVAQYRSLVEKEVEFDTRKLMTLDAFNRATADAAPAQAGGAGGRGGTSLRAFADQRRAYLMKVTETK